jgi:hypothetical protein
VGHEPPRVRRNIIAKSEAIAVRLQKICIPHSEEGLSSPTDPKPSCSHWAACGHRGGRERPDAACALPRPAKQTIDLWPITVDSRLTASCCLPGPPMEVIASLEHWKTKRLGSLFPGPRQAEIRKVTTKVTRVPI